MIIEPRLDLKTIYRCKISIKIMISLSTENKKDTRKNIVFPVEELSVFFCLITIWWIFINTLFLLFVGCNLVLTDLVTKQKVQREYLWCNLWVLLKNDKEFTNIKQWQCVKTKINQKKNVYLSCYIVFEISLHIFLFFIFLWEISATECRQQQQLL